MNVEIKKEEYRDLLDLLHIATWVLVFHKTAVDPRIEKYDRIMKKLYALAGDMGLSDLVEFDAARGTYHPTKAFEETSRSFEFIDEFVDRSFWDELIARLAERDAARLVKGYEQLDLLGHDERHALADPIEERYSEEFNERGVERLEIVEHFGSDPRTPTRTHD